MKPDTELLAAFGKYLRSIRPKVGKPLTVAPPIAGLGDTAAIDRALVLAEAKWFVDRVARAGEPGAPKWTFELTTRGAEAFALD